MSNEKEFLTKAQWEAELRDYCNEPAEPCTDREKEKPGEMTFTGLTKFENFTRAAMVALLQHEKEITLAVASRVALDAVVIASCTLEQIFQENNEYLPKD